MDDELRMLHEAMVVKERLRVLAELQGAYWDELTARGFDASVSEQLVLEWSRHAYGMTFRSLPEPTFDASIDELLSGVPPLQPPAPRMDDPSRVPPGEPWLQLVQELEPDDAELDGEDRAA